MTHKRTPSLNRPAVPRKKTCRKVRVRDVTAFSLQEALFS
jgi:hypothetical protein